MRISTIYINKFKNLSQFNLDFEKSYYVSVLLGKNGTGKSNLLEFITIIFKSLDLASSPANFKEIYKTELESFNEKPSDFGIEYIINSHKILVKLEDNDLKIRNLTRSERITFSKFKDLGEIVFPSHIIGYYSGKNDRFKKVFEKHTDKAKDNIREISNAIFRKNQQENQARKREVTIPDNEKVKIPEEEKLRFLLYANYDLSQLLLLTLFAFRNQKDSIKGLFEEYLKIDGFIHFSITLKSPSFNKEEDGKDTFWGVAGASLRFASFLYRISINSLDLPKEQVKGMNIESSVKEAVTYLIDADTFVKEVLDEFENDESEIFRHLESLILSDLLYEVIIDVKRGDEEISFSNLSEGEQQLISTIGLMMITGRKNSLYLLDEPDTHLNPKWQRDYIKIIKSLVQKKDNSHILMATHSPFISQAVKGSDLILFKKEESATVIQKIHNMHTWKIDQILTSELYELESTRASDVEYSIVRRDQLRSLDRDLRKSESDELKTIDNILEDLGVGRTAHEVKLNDRMKKLSEIFEKADNK